MKFEGTLLSVQDMERAKHFYKDILEQKIELDLGVHVTFESGFSLQSNYAELVDSGITPLRRENNFQLYFEVEDISHWYQKLSAEKDIEFLHGIKEYPWGQRVMRLYDFDEHIIEIAESMESIARRYLKQGFTAEQTAEKTMLPVEMILQLKD